MEWRYRTINGGRLDLTFGTSKGPDLSEPYLIPLYHVRPILLLLLSQEFYEDHMKQYLQKHLPYRSALS